MRRHNDVAVYSRGSRTLMSIAYALEVTSGDRKGRFQTIFDSPGSVQLHELGRDCDK